MAEQTGKLSVSHNRKKISSVRKTFKSVRKKIIRSHAQSKHINCSCSLNQEHSMLTNFFSSLAICFFSIQFCVYVFFYSTLSSSVDVDNSFNFIGERVISRIKRNICYCASSFASHSLFFSQPFGWHYLLSFTLFFCRLCFFSVLKFDVSENKRVSRAHIIPLKNLQHFSSLWYFSCAIECTNNWNEIPTPLFNMHTQKWEMFCCKRDRSLSLSWDQWRKKM